MRCNSEYYRELMEKSASLQALCVKNQQTLAVAESCTGGLLSFFLSAHPGASHFFLGSVVSYSYFSKTRFLDLPADLLKNQGAVNESACRLMVQGVKNKWKSNWALALTGVAGPAKGAQDPPVGVVFVGVLGPKKGPVVEKFSTGLKNRQDIQHQSAIFALDFLQSCITMGGHKTAH